MPENSLVRFIFKTGSDDDPEHRFDLGHKARMRRMREIYRIARMHHLFKGITPVGFRAMLEDLGPSFVKIGQTLSSRSEFLPKEYCDELEKLQSECDPLPFEEVRAALVDNFGEEKLREIFEELDPTPLGSASLAQVHKARLRTGETVAVKVQRPGVKAKMAQDIAIIRSIARRASDLVQGDQMVDFNNVVDELWSTFLEETDFEREAANLIEFTELNRDVKFIDCPRVFRSYCTEYVLVMEYVDGIPIGDADALGAAGYDLHEIGKKLLDNYATQILDHGFFHADPHPGNIIVREGKIVYIDLGIMGRLTPRDRTGFAAIVSAVGARDSSRLKDALLRFAVTKDNASIDHARFLADLDLMLADYASVDVGDLDIGAMLSDILSLTRASRVTLPSSITMVSRGIVTMEGTVAPYIGQDSILSIITSHMVGSENRWEKIGKEFEDDILAARRAAWGLADAAGYSGEALRMRPPSSVRTLYRALSGLTQAAPVVPEPQIVQGGELLKQGDEGEHGGAQLR